MFNPDKEEGCNSCSLFTDGIGHLEHLRSRNTNFVISHAPIAKIEAFKARMGWDFPWHSFGSYFNYDFHVTLDEAVHPVEYNFKDKESLVSEGKVWCTKGEMQGLSVFFRDDDHVYHTYSNYSRGIDHLMLTYSLLDLTPLGRQDGKWKVGDFAHHDKYSTED
jgi:predicted dithiol-disulfide oxidoreductase (DUF899 family)